MDLLKPGINVLLDAQWGSTGKGKVGGYLGHDEDVSLVCSSFGPNAGHTFVTDEGVGTVFKSMPSSAITSKAPVCILPDSVIDEQRFYDEVAVLQQTVYVHPLAAVVTQDDKERAQKTGRRIAGTMQGTGHAISKKLLRVPEARLAKDVLSRRFLADTTEIIQTHVDNGKKVILEVSQGFDLSLNHGTEYPYCTSRDITVGMALNSAGCPPSMLGNVIGSFRTYPIRVGNVEGGNSGPCHHDQTEITWADVSNTHGGPFKEETTTVTGRIRRVFTFSLYQYYRFIKYNQPDWMFCNFIQYLNWEANGVSEFGGLPQNCRDFIINTEVAGNTPILLIGSGAKDGEMINRSQSDEVIALSNRNNRERKDHAGQASG